MSFSRNYEKCYFSGSFTKARQLANFEIYGKIFWESNFTIKVSNISENQDILKTQQSQLPRSYEKALLMRHLSQHTHEKNSVLCVYVICLVCVVYRILVL